MADENNTQNGEQQQIDPQKLKELLELAQALKEAGALDEKLEADALESVAGGTVGELDDLEAAFQEYWKNSEFWKAANGFATHVPGGNRLLADNLEDALSKIGIDANIDLGWAGTGINSAPNTYVIRRNGQKVTHERVLEYIRRGAGPGV